MCRLHEQHCRLRWCGSRLPFHAVFKLHETAVRTAACLWVVGLRIPRGKMATSSRLGAPHRAGIQAERKRKRVRSPHVAQAPRTRSGTKRGPARNRFCRRSYAVSRLSGGICLPFCDRPGTLLVRQAGIVDLLRLVQTACSRAALIMEPAQDVPRSDC